MKTVSRNKFLLCFRPVVDMDLVIEAEGGIHHSRKNQALKYISESDQTGLKDSSNNSSIIVGQLSHRTLSKAKGVRDHRKSLSQDSYQSKRIFSRKKSLDDKSSVLNNAPDDTDQTKSNPAVLSSQSSFSSSCSTSSTISEPNQNQIQNNKRDPKEHMGSSNSSFNYAIGLLLLSLTVTIFWGRVCAILFTSIWLYFVPQLQSGCRSEDDEEKKLSRRNQSRDYKKRIILEGLLERSHRRNVALNF